MRCVLNVAEVLEREILAHVEKPSRYLGNEVNAVLKPMDGVEVRLALAFPDLYDLGLGNLGLHILYAAVNQLSWARCERVYSPAPDMERAMRERGLPLFGLESKDSLDQFDALGITLQSELTYTNILNLIDLAGIPVRSVNRGEEHPLVFAGGPAVFNPEPLAPFVDFFVIGDGEDAILEIAEVLRKLKGKSRKAKLFAMSLLEGVYVPALYPFETLEDGRVVPKLDAPKIRKRLTKDLNGATFPTDYIVPFTKQVHDRVSLEVLRGCTQGCRFCQAGMVTRPVRERKLEKVDDLLKRTLASTGYEEVSLVSLSTCDYSRVRQLVENTVEVARPQHVTVTLPSLRLDSYSVELSDMVAETRKSGITFAPEAASPRLRGVINKFIPDEELLDMSGQVYARGWDTVKLYFMIGLPTERDEDIEAIADLCIRTFKQGRSLNSRAKVNLGVSTFVPKPFTPFQWAEQIGLEETVRKQDLLDGMLRPWRAIKFGRHEPEETFLEGLVTRGDRRTADLIEAAWRKGARFDSWTEHLRFDLWMEAVDEVGFDIPDALRARGVEERLPWDHIDVFIPKDWFVADWERALQLQWAQDCRQKRCHKCGVIDQERDLCASMLRNSIEGRKEEKTWERSRQEPWVEPAPVQRLWFRVSRVGSSRFLSHLEANNAWIRSLRRAEAPIAYSVGFHPHPKVAYASAMPLGEEASGEYMDITLAERVDPAELLARLQAKLPVGFAATHVAEVPLDARSLMAMAQGANYRVRFLGDPPSDLAERVAAIQSGAPLTVAREAKMKGKGKKQGRGRREDAAPVVEIDIRPHLASIALHEGPSVTVTFSLVSVDGRPGRARDVLALLTDEPGEAVVDREETLTPWGDAWLPIREVWGQLVTRSRPAPAEVAEVAPLG